MTYKLHKAMTWDSTLEMISHASSIVPPLNDLFTGWRATSLDYWPVDTQPWIYHRGKFVTGYELFCFKR